MLIATTQLFFSRFKFFVVIPFEFQARLTHTQIAFQFNWTRDESLSLPPLIDALVCRQTN